MNRADRFYVLLGNLEAKAETLRHRINALPTHTSQDILNWASRDRYLSREVDCLEQLWDTDVFSPEEDHAWAVAQGVNNSLKAFESILDINLMIKELLK